MFAQGDELRHPLHVAHPGVDRLAVNAQDAVSRQQAGLCGGGAGENVADGCARYGGGGFAHHPDDAGKGEGEQEREERPCGGHDDFIQRLERLQPGRNVRLALNGFHVRHLRQGDEAARRNPAKAPLHAADFLLPERLAEPNLEAVHVGSAPARRQEVPELMHEHHEVEKENHQHDEPGGGEDGGKGTHACSHIASSRASLQARFLA